MADYKHPETIALHGGDYRSDPATTAVAVPIYQTTSYQFKNAETAANLFGHEVTRVCSGKKGRFSASGRHHFVLKGKDAHGVNWTQRACP